MKTRRVLMIAYHFPPLAGSSGLQRTLRFVQHLPQFGWEPLVLSAIPFAYERVSEDLMDEVPRGAIVRRALALDTARHLSIAGHYPGLLARPDRWMTWQYDAVRVGLDMIRRLRPDVVWSTYPIATAHVIGDVLHRRSRLPWIADFRDPMAQEGYPADPRLWRHFKTIEESALMNADTAVFTTPGAARMYRERYPTATKRIEILENGYDEESFARLAPAGRAPRQPLNPDAITLLHSGIVYPSERDPAQLFAALRQLKVGGAVNSRTLRIRFRAAAHEPLLAAMAKEHDVEDLIELLPPIGYRAALEEMVRADALLVLQASNCNDQIPAKLYEYLRAGRPLIALTDPVGDTAGVLRDAGVDAIAPLDSAERIAVQLETLLFELRNGCAKLPAADIVRSASRRNRAEALAGLLDRAAGRGAEIAFRR